MKQSDSKALEQIPGVGKRIAQDMANIGTPVRSVLSAFTPSASSPVPAFSVPAPVVTSPQMAQAQVTGACWVTDLRGPYMYCAARCTTPQTPNTKSRLLKWWNWKDKN